MWLRDLKPAEGPPLESLGDDAPFPEDAARTLVPLARFLDLTHAERASCAGVVLHPDDDVAELTDALPDATRVALSFPRYTDGRGYSQARLLRRLGFTGELLARGDIRRDQLAFLHRCGIDAVETAGPIGEAALHTLRTRYATDYQPAYRTLN